MEALFALTLGLLTASHLLRRYGEEVERRRREETGLVA